MSVPKINDLLFLNCCQR